MFYVKEFEGEEGERNDERTSCAQRKGREQSCKKQK